MAQSPEYPDLKWVVPRSWTNANRSSVQLIVIHTTEGSAHGQSAEDGAAYDARRTDGTSAHYFVDSGSVVQCVRTNDQAHTARAQGNRRGIQYELCGRAGWSAATWRGDYQQAMLKRAARQCARDAKKWGIPVRHLTVAQVADGAKGFCGHWDITRAFPQDRGSHTDPGDDFPWSQFLDMVRTELAPEKEEDMATTQEIADLLHLEKLAGGRTFGGTVNALADAIGQESARDAALLAAVNALAGQGQVDVELLADAVAGRVLAGLPDGSDPVSQEEVTEAVRAAFSGATWTPPAQQ